MRLVGWVAFLLAFVAQPALADTPPQQLRDAVRDLYKYEIRRLRGRLIAGEIARKDYAGHVVSLRTRYWLLSVPIELWRSTS